MCSVAKLCAHVAYLFLVHLTFNNDAKNEWNKYKNHEGDISKTRGSYTPRPFLVLHRYTVGAKQKFTFTVPYSGTVKTVVRSVQWNRSRTLIER